MAPRRPIIKSANTTSGQRRRNANAAQAFTASSTSTGNFKFQPMSNREIERVLNDKDMSAPRNHRANSEPLEPVEVRFEPSNPLNWTSFHENEGLQKTRPPRRSEINIRISFNVDVLFKKQLGNVLPSLKEDRERKPPTVAGLSAHARKSAVTLKPLRKEATSVVKMTKRASDVSRVQKRKEYAPDMTLFKVTPVSLPMGHEKKGKVDKEKTVLLDRHIDLICEKIPNILDMDLINDSVPGAWKSYERVGTRVFPKYFEDLKEAQREAILDKLPNLFTGKAFGYEPTPQSSFSGSFKTLPRRSPPPPYDEKIPVEKAAITAQFPNWDRGKVCGFSYPDTGVETRGSSTPIPGDAAPRARRQNQLLISKDDGSFKYQASLKRSLATTSFNMPENRPPLTRSDPIINQDTSFSDVLVMTDNMNKHYDEPFATPCSVASRRDTENMKHHAHRLARFDESRDIYNNVCSRLENMVTGRINEIARSSTQSASPIPTKDDSQNKEALTPKNVVVRCARALQSMLRGRVEERIVYGEPKNIVNHEMEWVDWLVEAAECGVLHLKVPGCKCRPEWVED